MNEEQFKQLIARYEGGKATDAEIKLLESWLESRAQDDLYSNLPMEEKRDIRKNVRDTLQHKMMAENARGKQRTMVSWVLRVAAVLLLIPCSYMAWQWVTTHDSTAITMLEASASGSNKKVILTDGTIVWLKATSTLTYPSLFEGNERHVSVTGEALFEVAKDAAHPFIIQCGDLTTKVLGTSFNIKSYNGNVEVTVLTGKVSLSSADQKDNLIIVANEKAVYSEAGRRLAKVEFKKEEADKTIKDTGYNMDFEDTPMNEIIGKIEEKFDVVIAVEDEHIKNCRVTADLTDQSLERTLTMISQSLGSEYKINDTAVTISGRGCE